MDSDKNSDAKQGTAVDPDLTLQHAKEGYANAQSVIKFIDTKTGVMTGLLTLVTAAPLAWLQWLLGLDPNKAAALHSFCKAHPKALGILSWGVIVGIVAGVIGIVYSVHGLMARDPKRRYQGLLGRINRRWDKIVRKYKPKHDKPFLTVLFPLFAPEHREIAVKRFDLITKGFSRLQILEEYQAQFEEIGRILHTKIRCNQMAISWFQVQVLVYLATGLLAYIVCRLGF